MTCGGVAALSAGRRGDATAATAAAGPVIGGIIGGPIDERAARTAILVIALIGAIATVVRGVSALWRWERNAT